MRILLTGISSFTGMWFAKALSEAGHKVVGTLQRRRTEYAAVRLERLHAVEKAVHLVDACPFGSDRFLDVIKDGSWDILCHHAAVVTDYKSLDFDVGAAVASNTHNIRRVLQGLINKGCRRVLLTGSVFEQNEGAGTAPLRAVSPYGLSKGLTAEIFNYYTQALGLGYGKFVIPNPFGPLEEKRFTTFLAEQWLAGKTPTVTMPEYIRDNVPVTLLAKAYVDFAAGSSPRINPSYYREPVAAFVKRFAKEMQPRLGVACQYIIGSQTDFSEPMERVNLDTLDAATFGWDESAFWDQLATFYKRSLPA